MRFPSSSTNEASQEATSNLPADRDVAGGSTEAGWSRRRLITVVALFADTLDAEPALRALERGMGSPVRISLLVRTPEVAPADATDRPGAVARLLVAKDLETTSSWLIGLASLIVPERGAYLVAGPLGAALRGEGHDELTAGRGVGLVPVLAAFGFVEEEAIYLEHRVDANYVLLAVTADDPADALTARQILASHDAIHISQGTTESGLAVVAIASLANVLHAVVGNAAAESSPVTLRRLCNKRENDPWCGSAVVDRFGEDSGTIVELLADTPDAERASATRYVVIAFGGVLKLGRQHVVAPIELTIPGATPVQLTVERTVLRHAPRFAAEATFTRRDEIAICAYFGITPYWVNE